jgi:hypothetical protein
VTLTLPPCDRHLVVKLCWRPLLRAYNAFFVVMMFVLSIHSPACLPCILCSCYDTYVQLRIFFCIALFDAMILFIYWSSPLHFLPGAYGHAMDTGCLFWQRVLQENEQSTPTFFHPASQHKPHTQSPPTDSKNPSYPAPPRTQLTGTATVTVTGYSF